MQPTITVRGEATREVPPELAVFSVSVSSRGRDKESVVARLAERSDELRAALDSYGAAIERRETGHVQVYPDFKGGSTRPSAYVGTIETTVTVADFGALGEMLPSLASMDQVSIFGPWWQLRRGSTAGAEVRRAAIADALDRAREYAAAVDARIDRLVEISDEVAGAGGIVPIAARGFAAQSESAPVLQLDPQRQTVQASVLVRVTITEPDITGKAE
ncbi:SIMPL domain-containing protein [Paractinoplanes globisporus]|jgi:uncharacterized protein YggE|uniref:SIMPL domain-containing protein n=1 Tax=Paractinoplanes globisporus TaxID=113565 RepID=A0ABW6WKR0_9ACTN|nr:SIMPL domain-containing protein [Actinoplanes globisporus]